MKKAVTAGSADNNGNDHNELLATARKLVNRLLKLKKVTRNELPVEYDELINTAVVALLEHNDEKQVMNAVNNYVRANGMNHGQYITISESDIARDDEGNITDNSYTDAISDYADYDSFIDEDYADHVMCMIKGVTTVKQYEILTLRLQGLTGLEIAKKLNVSHQAISKQIINIQSIINQLFPNKTKLFKSGRK